MFNNDVNNTVRCTGLANVKFLHETNASRNRSDTIITNLISTDVDFVEVTQVRRNQLAAELSYAIIAHFKSKKVWKVLHRANMHQNICVSDIPVAQLQFLQLRMVSYASELESHAIQPFFFLRIIDTSDTYLFVEAGQTIVLFLDLWCQQSNLRSKRHTLLKLPSRLRQYSGCRYSSTILYMWDCSSCTSFKIRG